MKDLGNFIPKHCSLEKQTAEYLGNKTNTLNSDEKNAPYILFQRALDTLVLFHKCPNSVLLATMKSSGNLIGILLSANEFKDCPSLSNFDYAYIGTQGHDKPSLSYVIRELSFKGWSKIENRHIL